MKHRLFERHISHELCGRTTTRREWTDQLHLIGFCSAIWIDQKHLIGFCSTIPHVGDRVPVDRKDRDYTSQRGNHKQDNSCLTNVRWMRNMHRRFIEKNNRCDPVVQSTSIQFNLVQSSSIWYNRVQSAGSNQFKLVQSGSVNPVQSGLIQFNLVQSSSICWLN